MIGRLSGTLLEKMPPQLLIDVQGVGYEVEAPMSTFYQLPETGQPVTLHTHMVVREDAQLLFGFASLAERSLFRDLIKISGVGGKLALTILSGIEVNEFISTVQRGDAARLTSLPGVGKKTAERLVIELKDRELVGMTVSVDGAVPKPADPISDALGALVALGYKPAEARRLLDRIDEPGLASEELIRRALKQAVR